MSTAMRYCPCGNNEFELPSLLFDKDAWMKWNFENTDLTALAESPDSKKLHHLMTCPKAASNSCIEIRKNFISKFKETLKGKRDCVVLVGGKEDQWNYYQSDTSKCVFKQEQFFRYLFGVDVPDCIGVYDAVTEQFHLFLDPPTEAARVFMGEYPSFNYYKELFDFQSVRTLSELTQFINEELQPDRIFVLDGVNSDSGLRTRYENRFDASKYEINKENIKIDTSRLFPFLEELRAVKMPLEKLFLRAAAYISSLAHCYVMKLCRHNTVELTHEALFKAVCTIVGGARNVAYTCICASNFNNNGKSMASEFA